MSLSIRSIKSITSFWFAKLLTTDILSLCIKYCGVSRVEFVCNKIDVDTYQIHIIFEGNLHNQRTFIFAKTRTTNATNIVMDDYIHYIKDLVTTGSNVMDIWPLNGIIKKKQFIKNILKGEIKYLNELSKLSKTKKAFFRDDSVKIMVLDLKHKNTKYQNKQTISEHELKLAQFFHSSNKIKINKKAANQLKIYEIITEKFKVDYILKEGSLKHDLLYNANVFNEDQIKYFNTAVGGKDLCQLCELIMNGFKSLFQVTIQNNYDNTINLFHPANYVIHIPSINSEEKPSYEIATIQNVELMIQNVGLTTFYPQCYLNVYSTDKPYYQCISQFNTSHLRHDVFNDFSNITCIQIDDEDIDIDTISTLTRNI
eukprot:1003203_1